MGELSKLAEYGSVGIAISLIIAMVIILKMVFKILGNHLVHVTEALNNLTKAYEKNAEIISGVKEVISGCKKNQK